MKTRLFIFLFFVCNALCATSLEEQFTQVGYLEICGAKQGAEAFDALYASFDKLIAYLQTHPAVAQKLYGAKERFIRTKDRNYYSADFFGFYDESERAGRNQVAFYYSIHFHEFIDAYYPEIRRIDEIVQFFDACFEMQKPYAAVFEEASAQLGLDAIFYSEYGRPPILFKVIKYLPSDGSTRPHYDGSVFSLFLDSTDNQSLLLSPYKSTLIADDFFCPQRECADSILLIPGMLLVEFTIYPTPHVVLKKRNIRYAAVAFAMRPNFQPERTELAPLPHFSVE